MAVAQHSRGHDHGGIGGIAGHVTLFPGAAYPFSVWLPDGSLWNSHDLGAADQTAMNQRGFIQLSLMGWMAVGGALVILAMGVALKIQTARLEAVKTEYAQFQANVASLGEIAKNEAAKKEAADKSRKAKADAENRRTIADLHTHIVSLRNARPGGGIVPGAPTTSRSPDRATFDRAELERTLRAFDTGVAGLIAEGDEARINLDTARRWANP